MFSEIAELLTVKAGEWNALGLLVWFCRLRWEQNSLEFFPDRDKNPSAEEGLKASMRTGMYPKLTLEY